MKTVAPSGLAASDSLPPIRFVAVMMLASVGQLVPYVSPFTLTALMNGYQLDVQAASVAISTEIGCLAIAVMVVSRMLAHINFRAVAVGGMILAGLAQIATLEVSSYVPLLAARALAGFGSGCGIAVAYAVMARRSNSSKLFFVQSMFLGLLVLAIFVFLPEINQIVGPRGQFLGTAVATLITIPLAISIRNVPIAQAPEGEAPEVANRVLWLLAVACVTAFGAASNAIWLHFEHLGEVRGYSFRILLTITLACAGLMVLAPIVALKSFQSVGGFVPLIVGCALQAIFVAVYLMIPSASLFLVSALVLNTLICVMLTYARILGASLDRSGRIAAGVGGADFMGSFLGPLIGGAFTVGAGLNWKFVTCLLGLFAISSVFAIAASRVASRRISTSAGTVFT